MAIQHIGYEVRPTARRHGHATKMRAAALPIARSLGIATAVLICDERNAGSRAVIEANGGIEVNRGASRRYEIRVM